MYSNIILRWALAVVVCLSLSACQFPEKTDTPPTASATREVELSHKAAGVTELRIQCGAGFLKVRGSSDASTIRADGDVYAVAATLDEAKRLRDEVNVQLLTSDRNRPALVVRDPQTQGSDQSFYVDLTVVVPDQIKVVIFDDAGLLEIQDLRSGVEATHGSGRVSIANIHGGLKLANTGESTKINSISGFVEIVDGTGRMEVTNVTGNIDVAGGNGDLVIRHVSGNVRAWDNPQGIEVANIEGDLRTYGIEHSSAKIEAISGRMVHEKANRP